MGAKRRMPGSEPCAPERRRCLRSVGVLLPLLCLRPCETLTLHRGPVRPASLQRRPRNGCRQALRWWRPSPALDSHTPSFLWGTPAAVSSGARRSSNQTDPFEDEDDDDDDELGVVTGRKTPKQLVASFLNEPLVELVDFVLVLASSLFVAISTIDALPPLVSHALTAAQDVVAAIFVLEFFARWFCSTAPRGLHLAQPLILVDVFVVLIPFLVATTGAQWLPSWLTSSSALINLRLLRVLRLQRVLQNMRTFTRFERALGIPTGNVRAWQLQLARVLLSVFTLLSVATGLIYTVEHRVNPQISDYFTALYFGLTTLTTVGFGDIVPQTWQGKLVVSLSILAGVAVIPAQGAALIDALLERQREKELGELVAARESGAGDGTTTTTTVALELTAATSVPAPRGAAGPGVAPAVPMDPLRAPGRLALETTVACPTCDVSMHWSVARYCWQCGRELDLEVIQAAAPDYGAAAPDGDVAALEGSALE